MAQEFSSDISTEGQELLEDKEIWGNETALREAIYDSRHSLPTGSSGRPGTRTRAADRMDTRSRNTENMTDTTYVGPSG